MKDTVIDAPKMFREMSEIDIENVTMNDADEVFWRCSGIRIKNLKLHGGTYPFMFSRDIYVDGLESDSKYVFQYVKNVEIHNARITTKDAFWEVENVTIYDSELNGEYTIRIRRSSITSKPTASSCSRMRWNCSGDKGAASVTIPSSTFSGKMLSFRKMSVTVIIHRRHTIFFI